MKFSQVLIAAAGLALSACGSWPRDVTPELSGVVLDQATHRPLAGVTVRIDEFPQSAVKTGSDGIFRIPALPRWRAAWATNAMPAYRIAAEAPGYSRKVQGWDIGDSRAQVVTLCRPDAIDPSAD